MKRFVQSTSHVLKGASQTLERERLEERQHLAKRETETSVPNQCAAENSLLLDIQAENIARTEHFLSSLDNLCDERKLTPQNAMQALRAAGGNNHFEDATISTDIVKHDGDKSQPFEFLFKNLHVSQQFSSFSSPPVVASWHSPVVLVEPPDSGRPGQLYLVRNVAFINSKAPTHLDWHGVTSMKGFLSLLIGFLKSLSIESDTVGLLLVDVQGGQPVPRFSYNLVSFMREMLSTPDTLEKVCSDGGEWGCRKLREEIRSIMRKMGGQ